LRLTELRCFHCHFGTVDEGKIVLCAARSEPGHLQGMNGRHFLAQIAGESSVHNGSLKPIWDELRLPLALLPFSNFTNHLK
jgi:hypothetical protein